MQKVKEQTLYLVFEQNFVGCDEYVELYFLVARIVPFFFTYLPSNDANRVTQKSQFDFLSPAHTTSLPHQKKQEQSVFSAAKSLCFETYSRKEDCATKVSLCF
jgi:hypothetical protein